MLTFMICVDPLSGLTALRADEVYDLMLRDAPDKSAEYARVLHEKEKQNISNKHKQYEPVSSRKPFPQSDQLQPTCLYVCFVVIQPSRKTLLGSERE